jgi:hypothetical protein
VEPLGCLHRVPFALRNDADKALVADDPDARKITHRAVVDGDRQGSRDQRADHPAMQHPRHLDVGDVVELAEHLGRDIETGR